jgi:hypothetical protein
VRSVIAGAALLLMLAPTAAQAANITPTRQDDPPGAGSCPADCSLRQAIAAAGVGGTVSLLPPAPSGAYKLTLGALAIGADVTIAGPGASVTAITGGGTQQLVNVASGTNVTISGITLTGGLASGSGSSGGSGGAIANKGILTLSAVTLNGNVAAGGVPSSKTFGASGGQGGAIFNDGLLTIVGGELAENTSRSGSSKFGLETTEFAGSEGRGGAIYNDGALFLTGTSLRANVAEHGQAGTIFGSQGGSGGAIANAAAAHLSGSSFVGNTATAGSSDGGDGGAIENDGTLAISQSTFSANIASGVASVSGSGGAIESFGATTIQQSTLAGNLAGGSSGEGGAIDNFSSLVLQQSTLSANTSEGGGGAIANFSQLEASNSTIAGNTATVRGGGIENGSTGTLANTTLTGNTASATNGGNIYNSGPSLQLHDSILTDGKVTGATGGENCSGAGNLTSLGFNLEDRNQCNLKASGDQVNVVAAQLGPLAANGGLTQTVALLPGSPAIDGGDPAGCTGPAGEALTVDQRSIARPQGTRCDIGAFELIQPIPTPVPPIVKAPAPVPSITALRLSPSTFRAAASGPTIAATRRKSSGTTIAYRDSLAATTSFTVLRSMAGVRRGRRCVAPPRHRSAHSKLKRCTRLVATAGFAHNDRAGTNRLRFSGRAHGRRLAPGSYTLVAIPKLGVVGQAATAHFTIKL